MHSINCHKLEALGYRYSMSFNIELIAVVIYWLVCLPIECFFSLWIRCYTSYQSEIGWNLVSFLLLTTYFLRFKCHFEHTLQHNFLSWVTRYVFFTFQRTVRLSLLSNSHTFQIERGRFYAVSHQLERLFTATCVLETALNFNCVTLNEITPERRCWIFESWLENEVENF